MGKKESRPAWFKLFRHQKALIDSVPDDSAGRAIKAVFQYFENGEVPPLSPLEFAVFSSIKPYVDESFEDFAEKSRKNKAIADERWKKRKSTSRTQSLPVVPFDTNDAEAEAEAEEIPLRDFSCKTKAICNTGDAASKGGTPPVQLFDPDKPETWSDAE